ncbi:MAG: hypothetical protein ACUVRE_10340 [Thermoanaerobaculaceae bacterium]
MGFGEHATTSQKKADKILVLERADGTFGVTRGTLLRFPVLLLLPLLARREGFCLKAMFADSKAKAASRQRAKTPSIGSALGLAFPSS